MASANFHGRNISTVADVELPCHKTQGWAEETWPGTPLPKEQVHVRGPPRHLPEEEGRWLPSPGICSLVLVNTNG